ncbi:MAG: hypothetical protein ACF8MJ_01050 [Phycisphaerales bacterium JB050]
MPKPTTDPEQNAEQTGDTSTDVAKLQSALKAEREAHKATKSSYLAPFREALSLGDDADLDSITATLQSRLGDADAIVTERTAAITAERDAAIAERDTMKSERAREQVEHAIYAALSRSGMNPEHHADAANLIRSAVEVNDKGEVVTKAADGVVAGQTPAQFIASQLRSQRAHYWPHSRGAGARSGSELGTIDTDAACFDPRSPQYSITKQFAAEARRGKQWADQQIARFRGMK